MRKVMVLAPLLLGVLSACLPPAGPIEYAVGDTGPGGGIVFYDKGNTTGGWRYLEMDTTIRTAAWLNPAQLLVGAQATAVGGGKENTEAVVTAGGPGSYAARVCYDLAAGGFSDWYLPSKDELQKIYENLKLAGLGGLTNETYWSSTNASISDAYCRDFTNPDWSTMGQTISYRFVAVRRFLE